MVESMGGMNVFREIRQDEKWKHRQGESNDASDEDESPLSHRTQSRLVLSFPSGIVVFPLSKTLLHGFTTSIQCFTEPAHAENYIPWLLITDGMRRPVSGRDALYAPKFIDVLRSECVREGPVLLLFVCAGS